MFSSLQPQLTSVSYSAFHYLSNSILLLKPETKDCPLFPSSSTSNLGFHHPMVKVADTGAGWEVDLPVPLRSVGMPPPALRDVGCLSTCVYGCEFPGALTSLHFLAVCTCSQVGWHGSGKGPPQIATRPWQVLRCPSELPGILAGRGGWN